MVPIIYGELTSPLRNLRGPPSKSLIYGNFKELFGRVRLHNKPKIKISQYNHKLTVYYVLQDSTMVQEKWTLEYGTTFKFRGLLGVRRPVTYAAIERQVYLETKFPTVDETLHY